MTVSREFNASNVEKAVERAALAFEVAPEVLVYEVLDQGSDGFLGIGARDARILVEIPAATETDAPDAPDETPTPEETAEEPDSINFSPEPEDIEDEVEVEEEDSLAYIAAGEDSEKPFEGTASDEDLEKARFLTASFVEAMGFQARIDSYETEDSIAVDIASDHTALLIGQKGETLDSLQHLVNCAASQDHRFPFRIVLDSEGYRQRRIEAIQGMAHRTARRVSREGEESSLPPMSSPERRVVHLFLEGNTDVTTYSEGSGNNRHVVIAPS